MLGRCLRRVVVARPARCVFPCARVASAKLHSSRPVRQDAKPAAAGSSASSESEEPKFDAQGLSIPSARCMRVAEQFFQLNIIEVSDLLRMMQKKMGVDWTAGGFPVGVPGAAGPVVGAPAAGGAAAGAAPAAAAADKATVNIKLVKFDPAGKIKVIKEVRALTNLGLKEAKEMVEAAPKEFMKGIPKEEAAKIKKILEDAGAVVELYSLVSGFIQYLLAKPEYKLVMVGLDGAGKTTLLEQMKHLVNGTGAPRFNKITPTTGMNMGILDTSPGRLTVWDIGGEAGFRVVWEKYYSDAHGVVYVIDAAEPQRFQESSNELERLLAHADLAGSPVLVLANKKDQQEAASKEEIVQWFQLARKKRSIEVFPVCAMSGDGITDGLEWLQQVLPSSDRVLGMIADEHKAQEL